MNTYLGRDFARNFFEHIPFTGNMSESKKTEDVVVAEKQSIASFYI